MKKALQLSEEDLFICHQVYCELAELYEDAGNNREAEEIFCFVIDEFDLEENVPKENLDKTILFETNIRQLLDAFDAFR